MVNFEYRITVHPTDSLSRMAYFCSQEGACSIEEIPLGEPTKLEGILNEYGVQGWELVQMIFGKDGLLACWKRKTSTLDRNTDAEVI
ncbi:DUF4177 domain-containing protein [Desulfomonile tiedjei]|uniref:DUF4177 domain-containing protein n=1 Tax=Desulfomonile tiedjei (strain ATCC 49306 / DSM 6799 / DCB-1) TaxID=706587 RepID=I4CBI6_DESTA|nr:DUF4177 domain-containing protein [Desulfomonile tiedjei]AFM26927.1 hypothetical protein Desti_4293 [Desulfomonile tiedjei DSM 6799]